MNDDDRVQVLRKWWEGNGTALVVRQDLCTRMVQAAQKCNKCADHCPMEAITLR